MRPATRFSARSEWIDDLFSQAVSHTKSDDTKAGTVASRRSSLLLPHAISYMHHDALSSFANYQRILDSLHARYDEPGLAIKLQGVAESSTIAELIKRAYPIACHRGSVRTGDVVIRTPNALSASFLPPDKKNTDRAIKEFFAKRSEIATEVGAVAGVSVRACSYIVLLTIHILKDGNGRLARLLYAADCATASADPSEILALGLLHRERGRSFHVAARSAREGNLSMLLACLRDASKLVEDRMSTSLLTLESALDASDNESAAAISLELHRFMQSQIQG